MSFVRRKYIIGVTGASGVRYALRLMEVLSGMGHQLYVVVSDAGLRVMAEEEGMKFSSQALSEEALLQSSTGNLKFYNSKNIGAPIASGSMRFDGMVIVPCSMNTLAGLASGIASNLILRAADVTLKEGRKLIVVPRETPLSKTHLRNMLLVKEAGADIIPAMPGFYHNPSTIMDLVDMLVMKILDVMGVENDLVVRWGDKINSDVDKVLESVPNASTKLTVDSER